ncbi:GFA family protein [Pseudomonas sp. Irchel s3b6]|uniref:GFA family protein n=1 Tax=Pseudomonas sp. Irchel s3b6 TaxID=2009078 RepID=UPI000BA2DEF9|nr:GFA family protein [Pseudomonas sp. Irchel s3b6]
MSETTYNGRCLCGWIRYAAQGPAENPHTCSCRHCQQHTGAPTAAWVEFPRDNVTWTGTGGLPATFRSSNYSSRAFCPRCGSSIGAIDDAPTIALLLGGFDHVEDPAFTPTHHAFADGQPDWWKIVDPQ